MSPAPEREARKNIDAALEAAGWVIQNRETMNLGAARGVAVVTPPLTGTALELLAKAFQSNSQMPERTLATVTSYPPISELHAPGQA